MVKSILVIGKNGQLASCLREIQADYPQFQFIFLSKEELNLYQSETEILATLQQHSNVSAIINCSAYTAVDLAESEIDNAYQLNKTAVGVLAKFAHNISATFFHISTDFVFPGTKNTAYLETDQTAAIGVYGASKLAGEQIAISQNPNSIIIRTSWLYSAYGNNFCKSMIRLGESKPELNIVNDQIGVPTSAHDLAKWIMDHFNTLEQHTGVYHFSNTGIASWFEFTKAIFELNGIQTPVHPIPTSAYPTPAKRPHFSVLNTTKIQTICGAKIPYWKDSLKQVLTQLSNG